MAEDIFVPTSSPDDAIVGPLNTVTYITTNKGGTERALLEGYQLDASGWWQPDDADFETLNPYFGFAPEQRWESCLFFKHGAGANGQVRVIHVDAGVPQERPELDGFYTGGVTISFPMDDLRVHEKAMAKIGMRSTMGVKEMEFAGAGGETYVSAEIVYPAPENVYFLGVRRPEIFVPVGPVDPATGIGGLAYSARNSADSEKIVDFLRAVLGYEIRRDVEFTVGAESALLMPEGARERFIQAFAPGASTGYVVIMDHFENTRTAGLPSLGAPARGIAMWSFAAPDLAVVQARAEAAGTSVLAAPAAFASPHLKAQRTLLLADPDGFPIEVFES